MTTFVENKDQTEMDSTEMWYITTRREQLQIRYTFLKELQEFCKKNYPGEGSLMQKEDQDQCELEQIEKELQALSERERELRAQEHKKKQSTTTEITEHSSATVQNPSDEDQRPSTSGQVVVELKDLSFSPALVQCPTCLRYVTTEIKHKVGKTSFLVCYVSMLLGCVGGCCLLPFLLNYFKDIYHICPSCQTEIQVIPRM